MKNLLSKHFKLIKTGHGPRTSSGFVSFENGQPMVGINTLALKSRLVSTPKPFWSLNYRWEYFRVYFSLPINADGGILLLLTRSRTKFPPLLISSMASACVMFFVLLPLISMIWSPTCKRPSAAAGPSTAILRTKSGMDWNSRPPRMENPKPRAPRASSTA